MQLLHATVALFQKLQKSAKLVSCIVSFVVLTPTALLFNLTRHHKKKGLASFNMLVTSLLLSTCVAPGQSESVANEEPFTLGSLEPEPIIKAIEEFRLLIQGNVADELFDAYESKSYPIFSLDELSPHNLTCFPAKPM